MKILYKTQSLVKSVMPYIARLYWRNWQAGRWEYPQLWGLANKIAPHWNRRLVKRGIYRRVRRRKWIEKLCGFLTGHEISNTEWGYGGGDFVDRNCRWCDKSIQIPKREEFVPRGLEEWADELGWDEKGGRS